MKFQNIVNTHFSILKLLSTNVTEAKIKSHHLFIKTNNFCKTTNEQIHIKIVLTRKMCIVMFQNDTLLLKLI